VSEYAPGRTTPTNLTGLDIPHGLAFDGRGDLFVTNGYSTTVSEYRPVSYRPAAGGVVLRTALPTEAMRLGVSSTAPRTLTLSNAELARIFTTARGTVTIGDSSQTGNITFHDTTPATTAGASTVVIQSTSGQGGIFLDASNGTAINGNGGTVSLTSGTGGVNGILSAKHALIASDGFTAAGLTLHLSLPFAPAEEKITLIHNTGSAISGTFTNLPISGTTTLSYKGKSYPLAISYVDGNTGNDLVLTAG
jgi:hypothetical protein